MVKSKFHIRFAKNGHRTNTFIVRYFSGEKESVAVITLNKRTIKTIQNANILLSAGVPHIKKLNSLSIQYNDEPMVLYLLPAVLNDFNFISSNKDFVSEFFKWKKQLWHVHSTIHFRFAPMVAIESEYLIIRKDDFYFESNPFTENKDINQRVFTYPIKLSEIGL